MTTKTYKRIILHAGLHKTGTTSIQDNCYKYRDQLQKHGIVYPFFDLGDQRFVNHSDPIATAITSTAMFYGAAERLKNIKNPQRAGKIFLDQLQQIMETPGADTLLLSAELVCDFDSRDMNALRSYLERYTESLDVIACVRSPHDSLISIIQQRCRDGHSSDPATFFRVVTNRYERLKRVFSDRLRVINFHEAIAHPSGLVGYFLCEIGVPAETVAGLEFTNSNERVSMEAYILMNAINQAFPGNEKDDHGLKRRHKDMHFLNALPGQRFQLLDKLTPEIAQSLDEQRRWLEQELQTSFPEAPPSQENLLWQSETLMALESAINTMDSSLMREVAWKTLVDEADRLESAHPETSETSILLKFVARKISASEDPPTELILQKLGADYFKFSALQFEQGSMEMSLWLMLLAQRLRTDAPFITERIEHYRKKLKESPK